MNDSKRPPSGAPGKPPSRNPLLEALESIMAGEGKREASIKANLRRAGDLSDQMVHLINEFILADKENTQGLAILSLCETLGTTIAQAANHSIPRLHDLEHDCFRELKIQIIRNFLAHHCSVHHKGETHDKD